jgi:hypothetical protein
MTLILVWKTTKGIAVIADTRFAGQSGTASTAGPKVFCAPVVLHRWRDHGRTEKRRFPPIGFAFAGNSSSGQTAHALAAACLQNLVADDLVIGPTVAEVASLYARCGVAVVNERRIRAMHDGWCFDSVVFGRDTSDSAARAFRVSIGIGDDANASCQPEEIDFAVEPLVAIGDGIEQLRALIGDAKGQGAIEPSKLLRAIIDDPNVQSVDGYQQVALAATDGVELHYTIEARWRETSAEARDFFGASERVIEMRLMGFNLAELGKVGSLSPTANHFAP